MSTVYYRKERGVVRPEAEPWKGCKAAKTGTFENYSKLVIYFKSITPVKLGGSTIVLSLVLNTQKSGYKTKKHYFINTALTG